MSDLAWPHNRLDIAALHNSGWRPTPFREFVLKVAQRCNLACDYCYVYTKHDQTWRARPAAMSAEVWRAAAARIGEHVPRYELADTAIVLHGGEPLLLGAQRLVDIAAAIRRAVPSSCQVRVVIQSNGVLLDDAALALFRNHRI